MAKRIRKAPVVFDREKFLTPKMEFFPLEDGTGFYICELGGKDLLEYRELVKKIEAESGDELTNAQSVDLMVALIVRTACDVDGNLIFTQEDVVRLSRKSPVLLLDIANKAMEISGIHPSEEVSVTLKEAVAGK